MGNSLASRPGIDNQGAPKDHPRDIPTTGRGITRIGIEAVTIASSGRFLQHHRHHCPWRFRTMHHRQLEYLGGVTTEWNDAAMARAGVGLSLVSGSQLSEEGQQRADRQRLRGEMAFVRRGGSKSPTLLLRAADRLAPLDAQLSREVYLEALSAEICADAIGCGRDVVAVAKAARQRSVSSRPTAGNRPAPRWSHHSVHKRIRRRSPWTPSGLAGLRGC